jgi:hypothetical protein
VFYVFCVLYHGVPINFKELEGLMCWQDHPEVPFIKKKHEPGDLGWPESFLLGTALFLMICLAIFGNYVSW